jgi:hypothetical protein
MKENCSTLRKICPSTAPSSTNPIHTTLASNPDHWDEKMATAYIITQPAWQYSSELTITMNKNCANHCNCTSFTSIIYKNYFLQEWPWRSVDYTPYCPQQSWPSFIVKYNNNRSSWQQRWILLWLAPEIIHSTFNQIKFHWKSFSCNCIYCS